MAQPGSATTLPAFLRAAAAAYGEDAAITLQREAAPEETLSYGELERSSASLAKGLIARGLGKGARVGFIHGNGPSFAVTLAGIARIGAIAVPISTLSKSDELVRAVRQADVSGLIVQRTYLGHDYVERLCEALPELRSGTSAELRSRAVPYLRWIASTGEDLPASLLRLRDVVAAGASIQDELLVELESEVHVTDQMIEIYTSGSTALPKGVKHSHGAVMGRAHYFRSMLRRERGQAVVAQLPMFWVGGLMMSLLPSLVAGATVLCAESNSSTSRSVFGALSDEGARAVLASQPPWALGMTETLGPYSYGDVLRAPNYPLCAPIDHVAEDYELRLVGEDGMSVGDGETGEIQVRGASLSSGLHKLERAAYFTPDGFFRTGDLGRRDGTRIHFVGRNSDIIKTSGANVSPLEVELELLRLEGVRAAYVVGLPDRERGHVLAAALVPAHGHQLDLAQLEEQLRHKLSTFKVPRLYVALADDEVPVLASTKVARRQLEAIVARKLGRG